MTTSDKTTKPDLGWPTCEWCQYPKICREQDECVNDGHSLFRRFESDMKKKSHD
jgi:hypothetical protein